MEYPGDTATTKAVARYFEAVAKTYKLPGILPVQASCVELTDAWAYEGDVKLVPGYLLPQDGYSVGYFQQQYDDNPEGFVFGWGKKHELIQPAFALRRFCEVAASRIDREWHEDTTDPEVLGRWCQEVQRSAFPDAYRVKGYKMAIALLEEEDPELNLRIAPDDWLVDDTGARWARVEDAPDTEFRTSSSRWLYVVRGGIVVPPVEDWDWPEAWDPVVWDGTYVGKHPTRYYFDPDVEIIARRLVNTYDVWCNTYVGHPPGWPGREARSVDVWHSKGRGWAIDIDLGWKIVNELLADPNKPDIEWLIFAGWIWTPWDGWQEFIDDGTGLHYDHVHITYLP